MRAHAELTRLRVHRLEPALAMHAVKLEPAGIERLVMEGLGEENIRDVIAFPKNQQAQEPMTGAPAPVEEEQLAELGLQLRPRRPRP